MVRLVTIYTLGILLFSITYEISGNKEDLKAPTLQVLKGELERDGDRNISVGLEMSFRLKCSIELPEYILFETHWTDPSGRAEPVGQPDVFDNGRTQGTTQIRDFTNITQDDEGIYGCYITSKFGTVKEFLYVKVINATEASISNDYINNTEKIITRDHDGEITCEVTGVPRPKINWYKDDKLLETSARIQFTNANQTLRLLDVGKDSAGSYKCKAMTVKGYAHQYVNVVVKENWTTMIVTLTSAFIVFVIVCIIIVRMMIKLKKEREIIQQRELDISWYKRFSEGATECINPELGLEEQADLLPFDKTIWEFNRDRLKLGIQLGSGEFGVVMKAEAIGIVNEESISTVAVKMVRQNADVSHVKALASELKIMSHLGKHLNVVNLLGASTINLLQSRELLVIVEYCKYGSLQKLLLRHRSTFIDQVVNDVIHVTNERESAQSGELTPYLEKLFSPERQVTCEEVSICPLPESSSRFRHGSSMSNESFQWTSGHTDTTDLTENSGYERMLSRVLSIASSSVNSDKSTITISTTDLMCWSFQIARGMDYLASRKVLHGDLAARNILLAEGNVVKICDFGMAKSVYKNENYFKKDNIPLPIKWMAVESLQDRIFSTQSDVWAFGIVLWELFSLAKTPYHGIALNQSFIDKIVSGYRMEKPEYATSAIYEIMKDCWHEKPNKRPTFDKIEEKLGTMLENSVRDHYIDLNATYVVMNELRNKQDYLNMMSAPTYCNEVVRISNVPQHYVNMPTRGQSNDTENAQENEDTGYLKMKVQPVTVQLLDDQTAL